MTTFYVDADEAYPVYSFVEKERPSHMEVKVELPKRLVADFNRAEKVVDKALGAIEEYLARTGQGELPR